MAPDKDPVLRQITKMLAHQEKAEAEAHKRAVKAAKLHAEMDLSRKEEQVANEVRTIIANASGFLYYPEYEYANLRTEPPCTRPEYSEYSKKLMREERRKRLAEMKEEAGLAEGTNRMEAERAADRTSASAAVVIAPMFSGVKVKDFAAVERKESDVDVLTVKEIHRAGASLMPNIQRLSLIGDPDSDDENGEEYGGPTFPDDMLHSFGSERLKHKASALTMASAASDMTAITCSKNKSADAVSLKTVIHHANPQKPKARLESLAVETATNSSHSPSPVKFVTPSKPLSYEGASSSGSPFPPPQSKTLSESKETKRDSLDSSFQSPSFVHPWPDLWPDQKHKRPKLSAKDWKTVNSCLGTLGIPFNGKLEPSDPQNFEAYNKVLDLLKACWLVMTGQISPNECDAAYRLMKPLLDREKQEKEAKLHVLEQKLKLRKKALKIPERSSKRFSGGEYSRSTSRSGTPTTNSSAHVSSVTPVIGASAFPPFTELFTNSPVPSTDVPRKRSSSQSLTNGTGSNTPSKRDKMASFTSMFSKSPKTPKSPKKGSKSHRKTSSVEEDDMIVTTPHDAPPMPTLPTSFSKNTPVASLDGAPATTETVPLPTSSLSLVKKISMSFGASPSINAGGNSALNRQPSMSFSSPVSGSSGKKKAPVSSDDTPLHVQVPPKRMPSGSFNSATGRDTPVDNNPFSPRVATPANMMSTTSSFASTVDFNAPEEQHYHARKRSLTSPTGAAADYNVFDAHLEELIREFRAWDNPELSSDEDDDEEKPTKHAAVAAVAAVQEALKPLDRDALARLSDTDRAALIAAVTSLTKADLVFSVAHAQHAAKFPPPAPNHRPAAFSGLPALALRIAAEVLAAANAAFLPQLDCAYELANAAHARRERACRYYRHHHHHPLDDPLSVGASRPAPPEYLRAGYACAWATRFAQWAHEAAQLWAWANVDVPAAKGERSRGGGGGGLRRPGRTAEVRALLNMVDERVSVDCETGEVRVEGEGAVPSAEEVERRFEALAEREEEEEEEEGRGMRRVWGQCEEQVRRLGGLMAPGTGMVVGVEE